MPFGPSHPILRKVARWTMEGFFNDVLVQGADNVPTDGPVIVCCTHWNMIVDPAILSCYFPHGRMLHYWAKSTIFINKPVSALLKDAGNIPVDRKNKDNQKLFTGTFDVLKQGECVAIFPEGTSYTEPRLQAIKEGASWAALEYGKNIRTDPSAASSGAKDATVVVASIVYTKKTSYRERAVMTFHKPIDTSRYMDDFMNKDPKQAVKDLTAAIRSEMEELTVNAPDWDTLRAAETARGLLWGDDAKVPLNSWREITQSLVNVFSTTSAVQPSTEKGQVSSAAERRGGEGVEKAKQSLVAYEAILRSNHFTNSSLNALPLPRVLDPLHPIAPAGRFASLWALFRTTLSSLIFLPFFILPLLTHLPIYTIGKWTQFYLNTDEPEAAAQNKIVFSLLVLVIFIYPSLFFFTWALFLFTPLGFLVALAWTVLFTYYHTALVDRNYSRYKKLVAAWRVLLGLWLGSSDPARNSTRRMLQLRSEAARATADLMLKLENGEVVSSLEGGGKEDDDQGGRSGADLVQFLRDAGARIRPLEGRRQGRRAQLNGSEDVTDSPRESSDELLEMRDKAKRR